LKTVTHEGDACREEIKRTHKRAAETVATLVTSVALIVAGYAIAHRARLSPDTLPEQYVIEVSRCRNYNCEAANVCFDSPFEVW
jgi:hypothetical protein